MSKSKNLGNDIGFFELLRQLETSENRFGRAGGPGKEPARLGQSARLAFATKDVANLSPTEDGTTERVDVNVIGLFGPEGPMPLHMTRWIMARMSNRWFNDADGGEASDTTFLEFCNMLQHRMIALYWRAWADARPEVQIAHGTGGRLDSLLKTLARLDDAAPDAASGRSEKISHGTGLAHQVYSPERLTDYLADIIGSSIELQEFVGIWTDIPKALQSKLGGEYSQLGGSAVLGARVYERANRIEIRIGPMNLDRFNSFFDDQPFFNSLRKAILFANGEDMETDLRLLLDHQHIPDAQLGNCQLGRTIWLNPKQGQHGDEVCIRQVTGRVATTGFDAGLGAAA